MGAPASWREDAASVATAGVRLSPVELANLAKINDPALDGYQVQGCSASEAEGVAAAAVALAEEDPTKLGRVFAETLMVGPEIRSFGEGPHGPVASVAVEVDEENPLFSTDGVAVYSKDGTKLIRLIVQCEEYEVRASCKVIGERAFDSAEKLRCVRLPDGLEEIGRLAFAKSGIEVTSVPGSVRTLGEKAFYCCKQLKACILDTGLESIGDQAFALSALERLRIPATVQHIGHDAFNGTPASRIGHAGTISVDSANETFAIDAQGGLYRNGDLAELLSCVAEFHVASGAKQILPDAFRRRPHLRYVDVAEGVQEIGDDAFRGSRSLACVDLPDSLIRIGAHAFMDTRIRSLRIGPNVREIGDAALLVQGESHTMNASPLRFVDLDPRNERFYLESGLLCERGAGDSGQDKAVIYVGPDGIVRFPDSVNRVAPYAPFGASEIDEVVVHGHMHSICEQSLSVGRSPSCVRVEVTDERDRWITLPIPSMSARFRTLTELFTTEDARTIFVFPYYDAWVTNTGAVPEFAPAALARLRDPIWLLDDIRQLYLGILDRKQAAICRFFAHKGDMEALRDLMSWDVLSPDTVQEALDEVMGTNDTQAIACLLELAHESGQATGLALTI